MSAFAASLLAVVAAEPHAEPAQDAVDTDLLEFLGTVDDEVQIWQLRPAEDEQAGEEKTREPADE